MISKIYLNNFRNHISKTLNFSQNISIIFGNNGAGKTSILEAISLFRKGKGLRSADLDNMVNNQSSKFTIYLELKNNRLINNIATSFDKNLNKRNFEINGDKENSVKNFPAIIWLNPSMCSIFNDAKNVRRQFLDKIVSDIDSNHGLRINNYDKCLRERMSLLQNYSDNKRWLEIIERKIAELGVAIAIARNDAIEHLNVEISKLKSNFIKTNIQIIGEIEEISKNKKSLEVEDYFAEKLLKNRICDFESGRSLFGIHRSDFMAILLGDKSLYANFCSTGEQKSILIALTIARVKINSFFDLPKPILLLDDIVAHLDSNKRLELFEEIKDLNSQIFMTHTNQNIFHNLAYSPLKDVNFIEICN